mmetsp:Transcript_34337/g.69393  ORF Transcript_34337/g.69393 Transcript_34337/m.69393 type:complete len:232 (+) Transcript_34337:103-798(+)
MDGVPTLRDYVTKLEKQDEQRNAKRRKLEEDRAERAKAAEDARAEAAAAARPPPAAAAPAPVASVPAPTPGLIMEPPDHITEPCIDVVKDGQRLERLSLSGAKESWTFGRGEQADFSVQHSSLSRQHASVTSHDGQMFLTDLGSVHGTFMDGRKLVAKVPVRLVSGANIRLGGSTRCYIYREPRPAVVVPAPTMSGTRPGGPSSGGGKGGASERFRYRSTMGGARSDFSGL